MIKRWVLKALIQKSLSFIPMGEKINTAISVMRGGNLRQKIEAKTLNQARMIGTISQFKEIEGAAVLEVGVGRAPIAPMLFFLAGAERIIGLDRVRLFHPPELNRIKESLSKNFQSINKHLQVSEALLEQRLHVIQGLQSLEDLQDTLHFDYFAPADAGDTRLTPGSIDIIFSNGVLEHIPHEALLKMVVEHRRILRQDGLAYHCISLQDHYRAIDKSLSGVNFLQYSDRFWETFVNSSIHYQNRLRKSDYLGFFEKGGGQLLYCEERVRDDDLAMLETIRIAPRFKGYSAPDLAVHRLDVILRYK